MISTAPPTRRVKSRVLGRRMRKPKMAASRVNLLDRRQPLLSWEMTAVATKRRPRRESSRSPSSRAG